jgi:hypothetical protein
LIAPWHGRRHGRGPSLVASPHNDMGQRAMRHGEIAEIIPYKITA